MSEHFPQSVIAAMTPCHKTCRSEIERTGIGIYISFVGKKTDNIRQKHVMAAEADNLAYLTLD